MAILIPKFHLHGWVLIVNLVSLAIVAVALLDVLTHSKAAFIAANQITKTFWIMGFVLGAFVTLPGAIAALFYFVEVRPTLNPNRPRVGGGGKPPPRRDR